MKKRKSIAKFILEQVNYLGSATLDALFTQKYAFAAMSRPLLGLDKKRRTVKNTLAITLSRLKREGLVIQSGDKWKITLKGKHILNEMNKTLPKEDGICRLVIFDIPEQERSKRDKIRFELAAHGFSMLQKSVWRGYCPLSEGFVELINALNLKDKVHIFSVQKYGTLHKT